MADGHDDREAPPPGLQTPQSLLERARGRDQDAWQRLVHLYRPLVESWCRRAGLRGADAEDVCQEAFAAAAVGLPGFRRDRPGDTFRGWLRVVTRNQIHLFFRRTHGAPKAAGGDDALRQLQQLPDPVATSAGEDAEEVNTLFRRALDQVRGEFEEQTWRAFWLTAVEGRSPTALSEEFGISASAIRQSKSRVLRRLKQEMGELLE
jgi:RNA polymerase sigma-70 factor (ECF subfamily)